MTWTYGGDPSASDRDEVRFLVGDTDTTEQLVTNEEIAYAILKSSNNQLAAACIANALAAKFARKADKSVGDLSITYSQQAKQFRELAAQLMKDGSISGAMPYASGISVSGKDTVEEDTDRVQPSFRRGQFDYINNADDWKHRGES
jgi:hypothetical protein